MCATGRRANPPSACSIKNAAASVPATVTACVCSRSCKNAGRFADACSSRCTSLERDIPCWICDCSPLLELLEPCDGSTIPDDTVYLVLIRESNRSNRLRRHLRRRRLTAKRQSRRQLHLHVQPRLQVARVVHR